jgi:hypothetical protein
MQSTPCHPSSVRSILILSSDLSLCLPSGLFPSGFVIKNLYKVLTSPVRTTCPTLLILLDRSVILLLTFSQSISPSWLRAPSCDSWPYFSLEENFGIVFRGASTPMGVRGCHVQGSQSLSLLCLCPYSCVDVYCY